MSQPSPDRHDSRTPVSEQPSTLKKQGGDDVIPATIRYSEWQKPELFRRGSASPVEQQNTEGSATVQAICGFASLILLPLTVYLFITATGKLDAFSAENGAIRHLFAGFGYLVLVFLSGFIGLGCLVCALDGESNQ